MFGPFPRPADGDPYEDPRVHPLATVVKNGYLKTQGQWKKSVIFGQNLTLKYSIYIE